MENYNKIKKQILKHEKNLSKYACKSKDAIRFYEENEDIRSDFERDSDKIIHSLSYTRYINKTQVYSNVKNDHISTRMTHVQFVSRAARTISRALGLNEDLCEAIALGHDVGHIPYGHEGERILSDLSKEKTGKEFAHNLNSVRIFKVLEKKGRGLNLTLQVLDGIMCHNGEMVKSKYAPVKKNKALFLEEYRNCNKDNSLIKTLIPMTMEGCVVRISDIIGYIGKDIEDAVRLEVFDKNTIPLSIKNTLGITNDKIMNTIILDIIEKSYGKPYISMSDEIYEQIVKLKEFSYENIYKKAITEEIKEKYKTTFYKLYDVFYKALKNEELDNDIYEVFLKGMSKDYVLNNTKGQMVIDYLAGMTDSFIESQYEKYVTNK